MTNTYITALQKSNQPLLFVGFMVDEINNIAEKAGSSPFDTVELIPGPEVGVEEVRVWRRELYLSPRYAKCRLGIIYGADKLGIESQNTLLKVLEEPPETTRIILSVENLEQIVPTVQSRCRVIKFGLRDAVELDLPDFTGSSVEKFMAAAELAKREDWPQVSARWLDVAYNEWRGDNYSKRGIEKVERFWNLTEEARAATASRRLQIEHLVLSCWKE